MPGGKGTLDELFEVLTLVQTGKIKNKIVILFDQKFWLGLIQWLGEQASERGYISANEEKEIIIFDEENDVVNFISSNLSIDFMMSNKSKI